MRDLLQCRDAIDEIDGKILELLKMRLDTATDVAIYKMERDQKISDKKREAQKIASLMNKAVSLGISPYMVREIYEKIMSHTVSYEQSYVDERINGKDITRSTSVAYLGTVGTYSHLAVHRKFDIYEGRMSEKSCSSFEEIVRSVETGECEYGMLPVENSSSGSINEAVDTLQNMRASITGELFFPIDHSVLICKPGANLSEESTLQSALSGIKRIYTHPQPAVQCSRFLKETLPHAEIIPASSSSEAMAKVKELQDPSCAALGSVHAARFYDLHPAACNIANNKNNYTRFIVISKTAVKVPITEKAKTTLLFCVKKYQPGSLIRVLNEFGSRNLNLSKLYSRPLENDSRETWEEIFFADVDANLESPAVQDCLEVLKEHTTHLTVLGCYRADEHVR